MSMSFEEKRKRATFRRFGGGLLIVADTPPQVLEFIISQLRREAARYLEDAPKRELMRERVAYKERAFALELFADSLTKRAELFKSDGTLWSDDDGGAA
jgi:hypothetical protein